MKTPMVCNNNYGMEDHLTLGKQYILIGMRSDELGIFEEGDQSSPTYALIERFSEVVKNSPRHRKTHRVKQKPPVRVKTDVVITYENRKSYTMKNISNVAVVGLNTCNITSKEVKGDGYVKFTVHHLENVIKLEIKSPKGNIEIKRLGDDFVVTSPNFEGLFNYFIWEA